MRCRNVDRSDAEFPCAWQPSDLPKLLQARERIRRAGRKPAHKDFDDHSKPRSLPPSPFSSSSSRIRACVVPYDRVVTRLPACLGLQNFTSR